ncbi:AvrD family protein [Sphingobacterium sp. HJSM2_6]|uniref:AvrD family protein n=1 Tax=Sphingobacterium sp. HJSM2_6 TaxID=3366264 RepID=UPI003BDDBE30
MKEEIKSLDSVLGDAKDRYFSYGFSKFHFQIQTYELLVPNQLIGTLSVCYDGPQRPQQQSVHLGSMEYVSIGLFLVEGILIKQKRLTKDEINRSLVSSLSMNIKNSHFLNTKLDIPFEATITNSKLDLSAINVGLTTIQLKIRDAILQIVIDHPGPTHIKHQDFQRWPTAENSLHQKEYKKRLLKFDHIKLDRLNESITAQLQHPQEYSSHTWGLSAYNNPLTCLDSIRVSGQLMQVLLYSILATNRNECPNIWLRSMEVALGRPYRSSVYQVELKFIRRQQSLLRGQTWQTVQLNSQIGNLNATYKICHEMP